MCHHSSNIYQWNQSDYHNLWQERNQWCHRRREAEDGGFKIKEIEDFWFKIFDIARWYWCIACISLSESSSCEIILSNKLSNGFFLRIIPDCKNKLESIYMVACLIIFLPHHFLIYQFIFKFLHTLDEYYVDLMFHS